MKHSTFATIAILLLALTLAACAAPAAQSAPQPTATPQPTVAPTQPTPSDQIANPASENCIKLGGKLVIETRPDGGQYGVCYFEDNRQCEEWALFRGTCPEGGLKVTGYITQAARFCAISGGQYAATANTGTEQEQGTCTFKTGNTCDATEYYNGTCYP